MLIAVGTQVVQRTALDQDFEHVLGDRLGFDSFGQVEDVAERSAGFPCGYDRRDSGGSHALDRGQSETDPAILDLKLDFRVVHAGGEHIELHPAAIVDVVGDPVGVFHFAGKQRRHELDGEVRLEIRSLVGDRPVGGRVRLVESVSSELFDHVEEFDCLGLGQVTGSGARDEFLTETLHHVDLFLADRLDATVRTGKFDAADAVEDPHHLLLVDHHSVGLGEQFVDDRVHRRHRLTTVLDVDVGHHHPALEWPRAVEGTGGDDVVETVGTHLGQQVTHAGTFELENALGFPSLEQRVGRLVVERQFDRVDLGTVCRTDVLDGLVQDGEVAEPEEVHLQQAGLFDILVPPLGDHVLLAGDPLEGHVFLESFLADHHAGRVCASAAGQSLETNCDGEQPLDLGVGVVLLVEVGAFLERLFDGDAQRVGHHLGDLVDPGKRNIQGAADIPDGRLGLQRAEGPDLGHVRLAVFLLGVVDHQLPAVTTEVDVDIGRLVSTRVQEPLEQQVVLQWADVAESQQESDQ